MPGQTCFLKQRRIGKLLPRAVGPLKFIAYQGASQLTAIL